MKWSLVFLFAFCISLVQSIEEPESPIGMIGIMPGGIFSFAKAHLDGPPQMTESKKTTASSTPRLVCGLNVESGVNPYDYYREHGGKLSQSAYNEMVLIVNSSGVWPLQTEATRQKGTVIPKFFLTKGGKNAIVFQTNWCEPNRRCPIVYLDDMWLQSLARSTGTSWTRTAILAHELGHIYYGHIYGQQTKTTWDQEYEADYFTGFALAKMGAGLSEAQAVFYEISVEQKNEDVNGHPSLPYRLRAVKEGFQKAGGKVTTPANNTVYIQYMTGYRYGVTVNVEGKRYDIKTGATLRIPLSGKKATLYLWECPPSGCRWTPFIVYAGEGYRIVNRGTGRDGYKAGLKLIR